MGDDREHEEQRVTPLELFFDLVFVFAITQVTTLMVREGGWQGLGHGLLALGAWWWAWASYSWLTNSIDPEEGATRIVMFAAMAAMLVAALATPRAFIEDGLLFAVAYGVVRVIHQVLYAKTSRSTEVRRAVARLAPTTLAGTGLLVVAGTVSDGQTRDALWCLALAIDYLGPLISGVGGWALWAGHFAERHGLIILIAIGESVVSVGGASSARLSAGVVTAAILAIAISGALWWAYFDVVSLVAERNLRTLRGDLQKRVARDSYTYLHLLMVAGIVLISLGIRRTVAATDEPLGSAAAGALFGGTALYLTAHVLFRLRNVHSWNRQRVVAAVVCLAVVVPARQVAALVALGGAAALLCALISYEAIRFRDGRLRVRGSEQRAVPPS